MPAFHTTRRAFLRWSSLAGAGLLTACSGTASAVTSSAGSATPVAPATSARSAAARASAPAQTTTSAASTASASAGAKLAAKELTFMRPSGGPDEDKAYVAMLSGWASHYPDTKATFISLPGKDYETKLLAEIAGGVTRDVVGLQGGTMPVFAAKDAIIPLDADVAQHAGLEKDDFFPAHWQDGQYQGKQWTIPPDGSPLVVAYNVDMFKKESIPLPTAAWTWDDCLSVAEKLTKSAGGQVTQYGCLFANGNVLPWLFANGANVIDTATNKETIDSANAIQALGYLGDLNTKYHVNPLPAEQSALGANAFLANKVGMIIVNRGGLGTAYPSAPFKIDVVPIPKAPATGRSGTQVTPLQLAIEKINKHPDDAWVLLQYLVSAESQLTRFTQYGGYPSRRSVANDPKFLSSVEPSWVGTEVNKVFAAVAGAPGTGFVPHHPRWSDINDALTKQLTYLWNGQHPADDVAKSAAQVITPLMG